jgi:hypothetical protein
MSNPYDRKHRAVRAQWRPVVDAGDAWCAELVCLMPNRWIQPGTAWDLAHDRAGGGYLGPAHAHCNRAEGGREKHKRKALTNRWTL